MSPLPSPTPLRRVFLRMVFSPAGLLFGFVVLLLVTCPGARGEVPSVGLGSIDGLYAVGSAPDITNLQVTVTRSDRPALAIGRSATPSERATAGRPAIDGIKTQNGRSVASRFVPMSGPMVGVKPGSRGVDR